MVFQVFSSDLNTGQENVIAVLVLFVILLISLFILNTYWNTYKFLFASLVKTFIYNQRESLSPSGGEINK